VHFLLLCCMLCFEILESATQFNREYSRFFGKPPMRFTIPRLRILRCFLYTQFPTNRPFLRLPKVIWVGAVDFREGASGARPKCKLC